jgi:hypothetical protein
MKTYVYKGHEVSVEKTEYSNNGTVALLLNDAEGELYAVATVNLCHPLQSDSMAFLDENNLPGIGKWIEDNHLGMSMGYLASSGFCRYPLYTLF